ncbi:MAG: hypothetical protein MJE77_09530 [Proteobacteria bacterium]|nr:hypothetical protein [Pseudomonadota bacterium]
MTDTTFDPNEVLAKNTAESMQQTIHMSEADDEEEDIDPFADFEPEDEDPY